MSDKSYDFYGWENADCAPVSREYKAVTDPRKLYDLLCGIWCRYTCAPRLRGGWSRDNITLGQCSITAFLAQDIFGGKVYGVQRPAGNYHCYNVIGDCVFDLTSEQFGEEKLSYENNPEQLREVHFAKDEKLKRYEYLRAELRCSLGLCEKLLTIDVECKEALSVEGTSRSIVMVPFTGTAEGRDFSGKVIGEGVDTQTYTKDGCRLSARYMLEGRDSSGAGCRIFIQNENAADGTLRPAIVTDSKLLAGWESAELFSVIAPADKGVTVRIYLETGAE